MRRGCVIPYAPAYSTTQLLRTFRGKRGKRGKRDMNDFKHLSLFAWSLQIGMENAIYDRKGEKPLWMKSILQIQKAGGEREIE